MSARDEARSASRERGVRMALRALALLVAIGQAAVNRYAVNPDGVTYLDIARALSQGEWGAGVNALWSPMYPALQAIALRLVAPAPRLESTVAHAVNVVIFAAALAAFEFFLRAFARLAAWRDGEGREGTPLARATWLAFA
ncbi:MAG TPA: hypothetical protein VFJ74_14850, partial [Gemmatimonadaceae bacterium]|nr:hypothetical protein [Gemmatimonadaceae bacterium]